MNKTSHHAVSAVELEACPPLHYICLEPSCSHLTNVYFANKLELILAPHNCESNLRRKRNFNVPLAKTKRLKNIFICSNCNYNFSYICVHFYYLLYF